MEFNKNLESIFSEMDGRLQQNVTYTISSFPDLDMSSHQDVKVTGRGVTVEELANDEEGSECPKMSYRQAAKMALSRKFNISLSKTKQDKSSDAEHKQTEEGTEAATFDVVDHLPGVDPPTASCCSSLAIAENFDFSDGISTSCMPFYDGTVAPDSLNSVTTHTQELLEAGGNDASTDWENPNSNNSIEYNNEDTSKLSDITKTSSLYSEPQPMSPPLSLKEIIHTVREINADILESQEHIKKSVTDIVKTGKVCSSSTDKTECELSPVEIKVNSGKKKDLKVKLAKTKDVSGSQVQNETPKSIVSSAKKETKAFSVAENDLKTSKSKKKVKGKLSFAPALKLSSIRNTVKVDQECKEEKDPAEAASTVNLSSKPRKKKAVPLGIRWLNEKAFARLEEGPSPQDTEGYIYIYKEANETEVKIAYKIGCSKSLPKRRIKTQENKNKKEYAIVESFETPWKFWTDTVIKYQLEQYNTPKEEGDGKTEWYIGEIDLFRSTIIKIIREINYYK